MNKSNAMADHSGHSYLILAVFRKAAAVSTMLEIKCDYRDSACLQLMQFKNSKLVLL